MPLVEKQPLLMSKERVLFLPLHYVWDRRPSSHLDKMSTPWNISPLVVYRKDMNHFVCKYTLLGQLKMDSYNLPKRILIPLCSSWFWVFHYGVGPIHIIFFYHSNRHLQSLITVVCPSVSWLSVPWVHSTTFEIQQVLFIWFKCFFWFYKEYLEGNNCPQSLAHTSHPKILSALCCFCLLGRFKAICTCLICTSFFLHSSLFIGHNILHCLSITV